MKSAFYFILIFLILSCTPAHFVPPENPQYPQTDFVENTEFFPETENPDEYVFYSNDSNFIRPYGMTFWAVKLRDQPVFNQIDVTLNKNSGNKYAGFGIVFCHGFRGNPAVETMLVFMINLNQEYIIGEVIEDKFSSIVPWTSFYGLNPGYSQENRVKIVFDSNNEEFQLYINNMNTALAIFTDNEAPLHRGGSSGFLTVISPLDNFPGVPVHIIYKNNN